MSCVRVTVKPSALAVSTQIVLKRQQILLHADQNPIPLMIANFVCGPLRVFSSMLQWPPQPFCQCWSQFWLWLMVLVEGVASPPRGRLMLGTQWPLSLVSVWGHSVLATDL